MDQTDEKVLKELSKNGRATASEISKKVNLSIPAVAERIRKLDEAGIIEGYSIKINRMKSNFKLLAFITVQIDKTDNIDNFRESIILIPPVLECHHIAGPYDYLIKVLVEDTYALEDFLSNSLKKIPGVINSNTTIVLSTLKEKTNRY